MNKETIKIQYPYSPNNVLYDGQQHEIKPLKIMPVMLKGRKFYVMCYYDININSEMFTLLAIINGKLYKVPLNGEGYELLMIYIKRHIHQWISCFKLKEEIIELAQELEITQADTDNEVWKVNYYVPINKEGYTNVQHNSYKSDSTVFDSRGNATVKFIKSLVCPNFVKGLKVGLSEYHLDENGVKCYEFTVEIPNNTFVNEEIPQKDGRVIILQKLMMPGIYHVTGYYSDFIKTDYEKSEKCEGIKIYATASHYADYKERPKIFKEAGEKKLNMTFDNQHDLANDKGR